MEDDGETEEKKPVITLRGGGSLVGCQPAFSPDAK